MRVQLNALIGAVMALAILAGPAYAADGRHGVDAHVSVYADDDATTVITPRSRYWFDGGDGKVVDVRWGVDLISSASVDVVSAATKRFSEQRHELSGSAGGRWGGVDLGASAGFSREPDLMGVHAGVGVGRRLGSGHRLDGEVRASDARTGAEGLGSDHLEQTLRTAAARLTWAAPVSVTTALSVTWESEGRWGRQSSPYRYVDVTPAGAGVASQRILERAPESRLRNAVALAGAWSLSPSLGLHGLTRLYGDDWGVRALTAEARLRVDVSAGVEATARVRGHVQSGASFYRPRYETARELMTADRKLAPMRDVLGGVGLSWAPWRGSPNGAEPLRLLLFADAWRFDWSDHPRQRSRMAILGGLEVDVAF